MLYTNFIYDYVFFALTFVFVTVPHFFITVFFKKNSKHHWDNQLLITRFLYFYNQQLEKNITGIYTMVPLNSKQSTELTENKENKERLLKIVSKRIIKKANEQKNDDT